MFRRDAAPQGSRPMARRLLLWHQKKLVLVQLPQKFELKNIDAPVDLSFPISS